MRRPHRTAPHQEASQQEAPHQEAPHQEASQQEALASVVESTRSGASWPTPWLAAVVCLCALLFAARSAAEDGNLGPETLSLPGSPASMHGLGSNFEAGGSMGTGSFSLPIDVPPGFLEPDLSLRYAAGRGRDVAGMSFELPLMQVYRRTDRGSPDFDEDDLMAVRGPSLSGELVKVPGSPGLYRLRAEGAFVLFVRDAVADSWTVKLPDGGRIYLGTTAASRETAAGRAYRWRVDRMEDAFGHAVTYAYDAHGGRLYLQEVTYQGHAAPAYRNRVRLTYEARPDAYTDYAYGSGRTTARRLRSIETFHGTRRLKRYTLKYREALLFSLLERVDVVGEGGLAMPSVRLTYVEPKPADGVFRTMRDLPPLEGLVDGRALLSDVDQDGLPDLLWGFAAGRGCPGYHYYKNLDGQRFDRTPRCLSGSPDADLDQVDVRLLDVDADGDRDVVTGAGNLLRVYKMRATENGVATGFSPPSPLTTQYAELYAGLPGVALADLNQDGRTDFLYQKPGAPVMLLTGEDGRLRDRAVGALPLDIDLADPRSSLEDFNGDGVFDLVRRDLDFGRSAIRVWYGLGQGRYRTTAQSMAGVPNADPEEIFLEDVNHDGQTDLIRVSGTWATFYLNDGRGRFRGPMANFNSLPSMWTTARLLFADMNGNGSTDIVWLTVDEKLHYLDLLGAPYFGLLERVENGLGMVTRIEYRTSTSYAIAARRAGRPWTTPMPSAVPVVSAVTVSDSLDVLGLSANVMRMEYDYRDGYYDGFLRAFRGFGQVTTYDLGDSDHEGLIEEVHYHLGRDRPGQLREVLNGLPFLEVTKAADGALIRTMEHRWEPRLLCQEDHVGSEVILPTCGPVLDPLSGRYGLVAYAANVATLSGTYERTARPRYSALERVIDAFGRVTRARALGEVRFAGGRAVPTDAARQAPLDLRSTIDVPGDERIAETVYIHDVGQWMIGYPAESYVTSARAPNALNHESCCALRAFGEDGALDRLEVLDRGGTAQVVEVISGPSVSSLGSFAGCDVGKAMLNPRAVA